jgi:hypothetical protein
MPRRTRLLGLLAVAVLVLLGGFTLMGNPFSRTFDGETYRFGEGVPDGWTRVCIAGQHEIIHGACAVGSLDEVPVGTVSVLYEDEGRDGTCTLHRLRGDFLLPGQSDTRCFRADEINGETLIRNDGVYGFENLQLDVRD